MIQGRFKALHNFYISINLFKTQNPVWSIKKENTQQS